MCEWCNDLIMENEVEIYRAAKDIIAQGFKDAGISDKKPFEVLARQLDAKKISYDRMGNGVEEEDNTSQLKATELAFKLKRLLDNKVEEVKNNTLTIEMSSKDIDRLEAISTELLALENRLKTDKSQQGKIINVEANNIS